MMNTIAIDIDDVLYRTSELIIERVPDYLKSIGQYKGIVKPCYKLTAMFGITHEQAKGLWGKVIPMYDKDYINQEAVKALNELQNKYKLKYHIVTARYEETTEETKQKLSELLSDTDLKIDEMYVGIKNKADFCEKKGYLTLLDDYVQTIEAFKGKMLIPILVATPKIFHNQHYIGNHFYRLENWNDLEMFYNAIVEKRGS